MTTTPPSSLSDATLLAETARAAADERRATADLVMLLAEVDSRRLYLGQGYCSLFAWCIDALHLSEPAAYSRITAARAARRYPTLFTLLADGTVTLTTVTLLAAHLTDENHEALLDAARQKSKREIERLIASIVPQPDIASSLRRLPSAFPKPAQLLEEAASVPACAAQDGATAPGVPARLAGQPTTAAPPAHGREGRAPALPAIPPRAIVAALAPVATCSRSR